VQHVVGIQGKIPFLLNREVEQGTSVNVHHRIILLVKPQRQRLSESAEATAAYSGNACPQQSINTYSKICPEETNLTLNLLYPRIPQGREGLLNLKPPARPNRIF
jgi:hypothetical protein